MSNDDDASNRLSTALDQIFSRSDREDRPDDTAEARSGDDDGTEEPYELPVIVPATDEPPAAPVAPTLPTRITTPEPRPPAAPTAPQAPLNPTTAPATTAPATTAPAAPTSGAPVAGVTTSWSDHLTATPSARAAGLRAPGRKPRVRRVTRVLRHIDPWSTFKVALLFSLVSYLVALTSGVLLWRVADRTGTLDNVERWFTQFGWETFELKGGEIFHNAWIIGLFGAVAMTGGLVLLATVFNLVSDIIGGVRLTVLEEEVVERTVTSTRRYVVRQGPAAGGAIPPQQWDVDADDDPSSDANDESAGQSTAQPDRTSVPTAAASSVTATPMTPTADWSVDD